MDPTTETTTIEQVNELIDSLKRENATYLDIYTRLLGTNGCISRLPRDQYAVFVGSDDYDALIEWYIAELKAYRGPKRMLTPRISPLQAAELEAEADSLRISVNQLIVLKLSLPLVALAR